MNKKGFAIIETIIVVVMMTTSLLIVYSSYSASITNEKKRIYYDDVVNIYKVHNIRDYLYENSSIEKFLTTHYDSNYTSLLLTVGTNSNDLFYDTDYVKEVFEFYGIERLMFLRTDFDVISTCNYATIKSDTYYSDVYSNEAICLNSFQNLSYDVIDYMRSLGSNTQIEDMKYVLVVEFKTSTTGNNTYAYVSLEGIV